MTDRLDVPRLETERLSLEPLSMEYSQGMFELWSDPAVCEYSGIVRDFARNVIPMPARTRDASNKIIDFWLRAAIDGWGFRWAIVLSDPAETFAGTVGFNSLMNCSEIAYHLLPAHWGKGLMTDACRAAIEWSRANGADEIEAFIEPDNGPSIALAKRLGMVATGELSDGCERFLMVA
jgi:ribosomal-protein-alanine N-acetyltransferase